jgi:tetratricopeptide (TPR) repeat protein
MLRRILIPCALLYGGAAATSDGGPGADPARRPRVAASTRASDGPSSTDVRERVIRFLADRVRRDPDDIVALNRLAGEYLARYRRSGDDGDLVKSAATAEQSLRAVPAGQNAAGLAARARALFALHRFGEARDLARKLVDLDPDKRYPLEILGDVQLELGDYEAAEETYRKMEAMGETDVNTEARQARLDLIRGKNDEARARLARAARMARALTPPAPEVVAWCLVQEGQVAFKSGDWDAAEKNYRAALEASPEDWTAIDHLAELRGAQRRFDEAEQTYTALLARVPRPELFQALGDLYAVAGRPEEARRWRDKALARYLATVAAGGVQYDHHLAGFYCDSEPNSAEAVKWAKKDLAARKSVYAWDGLAWALYQAGEFKTAAKAMEKALAQGTKDSHILYHASLVFYRAGEAAKGRACLLQAGQVNPKFNEFHVHR